MSSERFTITNRSGLKLVIQVDAPSAPDNLVFIAHGRGGFIEQVHIQAYTDVFLANNFRVVRFDATHSIGESEGDTFDVTYDSYIADLEDVINWARAQAWFKKLFALAGHSMGAQSTAWYAECHPEEIKLLASGAPTINYDLWRSSNAQRLGDWQKKGYTQEPSRSKPGLVPKFGWQLAESLNRFDILPLAQHLTMPVLIMVGEFDSTCPSENQKIFLDLIPSSHKKLVKIAGVEHSFRDAKTGEYDEKLDQVKQALNSWLKEVKSY